MKQEFTLEVAADNNFSILNRIVVSVAERGFPPSMRELAAAEHLIPSGVHYQLKELERKGRIRRESGVARGIQVVHHEAAP